MQLLATDLFLERGHLLRLAQGVHGDSQEDIEQGVVAEHREEDEVQRVYQAGLEPNNSFNKGVGSGWVLPGSGSVP